MSFLFLSFFAVTSTFTVQPLPTSPGTGIECPAPAPPPLS